VVLVIAFVLLSGYTVVTTNGKEHGSMEQKKNLCAQVPLSLHAQVCEAREAAGQTTSEYITNLLIEYYNLKKNGGTATMSGNTRTMAFQIPEELFQRIKAHLERETQRTGRKLTQREFVLNLIEEALIEAEEDAAEEAERVNASMASASPTGTTTEEDDPEEDLPPEKP
jgi:predicted DNA-binding protein